MTKTPLKCNYKDVIQLQTLQHLQCDEHQLHWWCGCGMRRISCAANTLQALWMYVSGSNALFVAN